MEGTIQFAERMGWVDDREFDKQLLDRLFGVEPNGSGALRPAADHPFKKAELGWYPTERDCCLAYEARFWSNTKVRKVTKDIQLRPDDSIILFGSQVSNLQTRQYFGDPFGREKPNLQISDPEGRWRASLLWNLYTPPEAAVIERQQFGAPWFTQGHIIGGEATSDSHRSVAKEGGLEDDFLLITVLPRYDRGLQRVIVFAGCHGPGQMAATSVLTNPPLNQLKEVMRRTRGEPYYQALFHIAVTEDDQGESRPDKIELVDASPIEVDYARR